MPLSRSECIAYGAGIVAFELCSNGFTQLVKPLYNIELGVSPATIGFVLFITRLWDAVTDPLMGAVSDNTRTRWGRRRPWLAIGAICCAVAYPLLWLPTPEWQPSLVSGYLLAASLLYYMMFTVYAVPYMALGFEITPDSQERVRLQVWRSAFAFVPPIAAGWFYWLCQLPVFDDAMTGARWLGVGVAGLILLSGLAAARCTRERYYRVAVRQQRLPLWPSLEATMRNRSFVVVMAVCVLLLLNASGLRSLGAYAKIYIVAGGDTRLGAELNGWAAMASAAAGLATIPCMSWLVGRFGKRRVLSWILLVSIVAALGTWLVLRPGYFIWCLVPHLLIGPASAAFWILANAMKADCCDLDEDRTGARREGTYGAVSNFLQKVAISISLLLSGQILVGVGFDAALGAAQSTAALEGIRLATSLGSAAVLCIAYAALQYYLPDEASMRQVRRRLESRRGGL